MNALKPIVLVSVALAAVASTADTLTWIGGSSGAAKTAANWDPSASPDAPNEALITNTVTFTETGTDIWWRFSRVTVKRNSTVTYSARFSSPTTMSYLSDNQCFVDIEAGSLFKPGYVIGYKNATFVKVGGGTIQTGHIGHSGSDNIFKNIWVKEGKAITSDGSDGGIYASSGITVDSGAELVIMGPTQST